MGDAPVNDSPQLRMYFSRFYDLPDLKLPPGVTLKKFEPGDEGRWAAVLQAAGDLGAWSPERAKRALSGPARVDSDGIHFLVVDGKAVATACVQVNDARPDLPELGYVSVMPEYRGHGFGRLISLAVLKHIEERGHRSCFLRTDDHRLAAIKTYMRLGFDPDLSHSSYPKRWEALWTTLGYRAPRPFRLGIVGRRGTSSILAAQALPDLEVVALCDIDEATLHSAAEKHGIAQRYTRYEEMLDADIDAVLVATPMPLHVPQSIAALRAGKHVLSEVTAAVTFEESWELLEAVHASGKTYMMAENYCYIRSNVLVRELVRKGLFGQVYFGEGEYIHELKALNEQTPWRRVWQTGRNGNTYPTHSLGPLMQWMNDRVVSVSCMGSGHHYEDARGARYENEDTTLTLCKLESGGLVKLRLDMLSNRPHNMAYYSLQGTKGCYEAPRSPGDQHKIWLEGSGSDPNRWQLLSDYEEFLPELWKNPPPEAQKAGHGGGDFWVIHDFVAALSGRKPPAIDVVTALEWTAAGLASEISISRGGSPVDLPDFRAAWRAKRSASS